MEEIEEMCQCANVPMEEWKKWKKCANVPMCQWKNGRMEEMCQWKSLGNGGRRKLVVRDGVFALWLDLVGCHLLLLSGPE